MLLSKGFGLFRQRKNTVTPLGLSSILALMLFCINVFATEFEHELFNQNQGFPTSIIFSIKQDKHGFLWFGTAHEGLLRFDGEHVTSFANDPDDSSSLPRNNAGNLLIDSKGDLWIGSWGGGVINYEYDQQRFVQYIKSDNNKNTVSGRRVQSLFEDEQGNLWFGTFSKGINRFNPSTKQFTRYPFITGYEKRTQASMNSSSRIWDINQVDNNGLWLATNNGLNYLDFDSNTFSHFYPFPQHLEREKNQIRQLAVADDETLFLGTDNGVLKFDINSSTFKKLPVDSSRDLGPIYSILKTKMGDYWVASEAGVYSFNQDKLTLQKVNLGFDDSCAQKLFQDRQDTIWLSCEGVGVYKITRINDVVNVKHPELKSALALQPSYDGAILVGTHQNGLKKWHPKTNAIESITENNETTSEIEVHYIAQTSENEIWLANLQSAYRVNNAGERIPFEPAKEHRSGLRHIRDLSADHQDNIWISSTYAIFRINPNTLKYDYFAVEDVIESSTFVRGATMTFVDAEMNIWVTIDNQMFRFDETSSTFIKLTYAESPAERQHQNNYVHAVYQDSDNVYWLANSLGLFQVDIMTGDRQLVSSYFNDIENRVVQHISEDAQGDLWLITKEGISRLSKKSGVFHHFDNRDGLPGSRYYKNSPTKHSDGTLFFSTRDGIHYFDPNEFVAPQTTETIRLTNFDVLGSDKTFIENDVMLNGLSLLSNQTNIRFEFAALDLINASQIQYEYMLSGFDDGWVNNGSLNTAMFTNLKGGHYVFRVRARLKDNQYFTDELSIDIAIATPIWQRWWMMLVYAAIALAGFALYLRRQKLAVLKLEQQVAEKTADIALESKKLADANRFKTRFLANMSHEVRTPLTTVIGQVEAIICGEVSQQDLKKELGVIHDSSIHLLTLLNDILDLTKIEENKLQLVNAPQDLHSLLSTINTMFSMQAKAKGLSFTLEEHLPHPCIVLVDGLRLKQILINLLSNAVKFTQEGHVFFNVEMSDETLTFRVQDTGLGISDEHMPQIFESFTQGDTSIGRRFGGSGLGLHLSNQLAALMKGNISVESKLGSGSTFTFSMPMPERSPAKETKDANDAKDAEQYDLTVDTLSTEELLSGTVLLAEDHDENRRLVARLLKKMGLTVVTARDGEEALAQFSKHDPDIILLDIQMPRKDGLQAYKELKELGCTKPIIALTANAMATEVEEYFSLGFDNYIQKPIDRSLFISTISAYLEANNDQKPNRAESILGNVDMSDLVEEFKKSLPNELKAITEYVSNGNVASISSRAHRLSGAAELFGFKDLSAFASKVDNKIKTGCKDIASIKPELDILEKEIEKCCQ